VQFSGLDGKAWIRRHQCHDVNRSNLKVTADSSQTMQPPRTLQHPTSTFETVETETKNLSAFRLSTIPSQTDVRAMSSCLSQRSTRNISHNPSHTHSAGLFNACFSAFPSVSFAFVLTESISNPAIALYALPIPSNSSLGITSYTFSNPSGARSSAN
jgi:hypothetical protein